MSSGLAVIALSPLTPVDILLGIADQSADPVGRCAACPSPVVQASTNEVDRYLALVGHDYGAVMKEETDRFRADDNKFCEPSADIGCARRLNGSSGILSKSISSPGVVPSNISISIPEMVGPSAMAVLTQHPSPGYVCEGKSKS